MRYAPEELTTHQQERLERAENRAEGLRAASNASFERAHNVVKHIPFGQPILVGHHSERHHRRDLDKHARAMDKGCALANEAEAAEWAVSGAGHAISSDDPEALTALQTKLAKLQATREVMKAANKADKKAGVQCRPWERPFPPYKISNIGANIRSVEDRIEQLTKAATTPEREPVEGPGFKLEEDRDANRVCFYFQGKPAEEIRNKLKANGFRWSPSEGRWQRQLTGNAWWYAERLAKELGA
jgi:hypothetical protein